MNAIQKQKNIYDNLLLLFKELEERLIQREEFIRVILITIFAKENAFFLGRRGVGKTYGVQLVGDCFDGAKPLWSLQVSVNTIFEEIFGKRHRDNEGKMIFDITNTVLDHEFVFLDEMFKASGPILSGLLELLADKVYTMGDGKRHQTPLISLFGASNEYPTENYMKPFVDRFLFFFEVLDIQGTSALLKYLSGDFKKGGISKRIFHINILDFVNEEAEKIEVSREFYTLFIEIIHSLRSSGVETSDRKYGKMRKVFQISAFLNNRNSVNFSDLLLMRYMGWHSATEKERLLQRLPDKLFNTSNHYLTTLKHIKNELERIISYKKKNFTRILKFELDFTGVKNKMEEFDKYKMSLRNVFIALEEQAVLINNVVNEYNRYKDILRDIKENIFISDYEVNVFNKEVVSELDQCIKMAFSEMEEVEHWLINYIEYWQYDQKVLSIKKAEKVNLIYSEEVTSKAEYVG